VDAVVSGDASPAPAPDDMRARRECPRARLLFAQSASELTIGEDTRSSSEAGTWRDRRETLAYPAKEKHGIGAFRREEGR